MLLIFFHKEIGTNEEAKQRIVFFYYDFNTYFIEKKKKHLNFFDIIYGNF